MRRISNFISHHKYWFLLLLIIIITDGVFACAGYGGLWNIIVVSVISAAVFFVVLQEKKTIVKTVLAIFFLLAITLGPSLLKRDNDQVNVTSNSPSLTETPELSAEPFATPKEQLSPEPSPTTTTIPGPDNNTIYGLPTLQSELKLQATSSSIVYTGPGMEYYHRDSAKLKRGKNLGS